MRAILKQTSWLFAAQSFTRVIGFFYTIFLARNLGVEDFGLYSVALAYFSIISSITDFGLTRFLIREIARDSAQITSLTTSVSFLRLTFATVLFAIFALILYFLDPDKSRVSITLLAVMATIPQGVSLTLDGIFVAIRKLQYSSISLIALSLSTAILGVLMIAWGFGPTGVVTALILGQIFDLVLKTAFLKKLQFKYSLYVTWQRLKEIILGSLPYGFLSILGLIYFKVDILLLSYLKGNFDTGIYGAAYRFFEAVVFIPSALSTALFPVLVKLHIKNLDQVRKLYFKSLKILFVLGIAVLLIYILVLPVIIRLLLPSYLPATQAITILSLAIPFMFSHFPAVQVLLSSEKYLKITVLLAFFMLTLNISLNLIFIPKYGFVAAAWITVLSEALSFLIFFKFLMNKILRKSL